MKNLMKITGNILILIILEWVIVAGLVNQSAFFVDSTLPSMVVGGWLTALLIGVLFDSKGFSLKIDIIYLGIYLPFVAVAVLATGLYAHLFVVKLMHGDASTETLETFVIAVITGSLMMYYADKFAKAMGFRY